MRPEQLNHWAQHQRNTGLYVCRVFQTIVARDLIGALCQRPWMEMADFHYPCSVHSAAVRQAIFPFRRGLLRYLYNHMGNFVAFNGYVRRVDSMGNFHSILNGRYHVT